MDDVRSVSAFGSAVVHTQPDVAHITLSVVLLEETPDGAFDAVNAASQRLHSFLEANGLDEIRSSRMTLSARYAHRDGQRVALGFEARRVFTMVNSDLDRTDQLLAGAISAGANELGSVRFATSQLQEVRSQARTLAMEAARRKAEVYAAAEGAEVGEALEISDENPDGIRGNSEGAHAQVATMGANGDEDGRSIDPGAVTVTAAVRVRYQMIG